MRPPGFQSLMFYISRSKEDKEEKSQVELSVISLERLLEAGGALLLTPECLEG